MVDDGGDCGDCSLRIDTISRFQYARRGFENSLVSGKLV